MRRKITLLSFYFLQSQDLVGGDRGAGARENRGREGYGRREKKGGRWDLYDGGKRERDSKSQAFFFVTAYFQSKKRTQQRFLTSI